MILVFINSKDRGLTIPHARLHGKAERQPRGQGCGAVLKSDGGAHSKEGSPSYCFIQATYKRHTGDIQATTLSCGLFVVTVTLTNCSNKINDMTDTEQSGLSLTLNVFKILRQRDQVLAPHIFMTLVFLFVLIASVASPQIHIGKRSTHLLFHLLTYSFYD